MKSILIVGILIVNSLFAQDYIDLFQTYTRYSPANNSEYFEKVEYLQFGGEAKLPIVLKNKNVIIIGGEFNALHFDARHDTQFHEKLYETRGLFGYKHNWSEKWNTLTVFAPKLTGEYKTIKTENFQFGGLVLNSFKKSEHLELKFGAYFNQESFGPMIVPLLGWNWKVNDSWRIKGTLPVNLDIIHSGEQLNYGLQFIGKNASFLKSTAGKSQYVDMADNNVWAFGEFKLTKNWLIHAKAGHSVLRKFSFYDEGNQMNMKLGPVNIGDNRATGTPWFNNGWSFEMRMIYRFPTK